MSKKMIYALIAIMSLLSLNACRYNKKTVAEEEVIKRAQDSDLKGYWGKTDTFTEKVRSGKNVVASIGSAHNGTHLMVGVVDLQNGSVKMTLWGSPTYPEVGMSAYVTCIKYFDPASTNVTTHREVCVTIPTRTPLIH